MKRESHVCQNCWYFESGRCYNCDSPSDIRAKTPDDVCDGGGLGADGFGFEPKEKNGSAGKGDDLESEIIKLKAENKKLKAMMKVMDVGGCALLDFIESQGLMGECKRYLKAECGACDHES